MKNLFRFIVTCALLFNFSNAFANENTQYTNQCNPPALSQILENNQKEINIVFSDIDGTILKFDSSNPTFTMPQEIKDAVENLSEKNIPLILATGRSYNEAKEIADSMNNSETYIISSQGAQINDKNGKIIYETSISKKESTKIYKEILKYKKEHGLDSCVYIFSQNKMFSPENRKPPYIWEKLFLIKSMNDIGKDFTCTKIVILECDPQKILSIQNHMKNKFPLYKIDISASCYCDITSPMATKGNAVKVVAKLLNKNLENAVVFGDAENDISMFETINKEGGVSIVVQNGMENLKKVAKSETSSVYEFGVAKGINQILKHNDRIKSNKLTPCKR